MLNQSSLLSINEEDGMVCFVGSGGEGYNAYTFGVESYVENNRPKAVKVFQIIEVAVFKVNVYNNFMGNRQSPSN